MNDVVREVGLLYATRRLRQLGICQGACLVAVVALIWLNEVYDFAAAWTGAVPSPGEWTHAGVLTAGVAALGLVSMVPICKLNSPPTRRAITVCSYCHRVHNGGGMWQPLQEYVAERANGALSHGVCPDCRSRVMEDYRAGRKNAGARETIAPDVAL